MTGSVPGFPEWRIDLFLASSAGEWVDGPCLPGESLGSLVVLWLRWAGSASGLVGRPRRLCWSAALGWRPLSSRVLGPLPMTLGAALRASGLVGLPSGLPEAVGAWLPPLTPEFLLALEVMGS